MPNAIPFTALGGGNGFSGCLSKVDVSSYANWCTLSGLSSGPASKESIEESWRLAMQLFWNSEIMYAFGDMSVSSSSTDGFSFNTSSAASNSNTFEVEPRERVCISRVITDRKFVEDPFLPGSLSAAFVEFNYNIEIVRMYDGSTANEDNFVGYGISGGGAGELSTGMATGTVGPSGGTLDIELLSYTNETDITTSTETQRVDKTVINTPIGGATFICRSIARSSESGTFGIPPETTTVSANRNASASGRSASMSESVTRVDIEIDEEGEEFEVTTRTNVNSSARIQGFNFYTY